MISLDDALALIDAEFVPVAGIESQSLGHALGRILAQDVTSLATHPPVDNAAMDGWAFGFSSLDQHRSSQAPCRLRIVGRVAAGHPWDKTVSPGEAVRIFTGAQLPPGCDTVIAQEDAQQDDETFVTLSGSVTQGGNVRSAGEDFTTGGHILSAGTRLVPQHIALAAAAGHARLDTRKPLRVAVFSTGDELAEAGAALPPSHIHDSNRPLLVALLAQAGCAITDLGILPDTSDRIAHALAQAAPGHDLILTSGGASVGDEDHVRHAMADAGGTIDLWKLAVKPGKPLALGRIGACRFVALPGNPVAVMVGFLLVVRHVIDRLAGTTPAPLRRLTLPAAFSFKSRGKRREFLRGRLVQQGAGWAVEIHPINGSHILSSLTWADGLVDLPAGQVHIQPGDDISFLPFSEAIR